MQQKESGGQKPAAILLNDQRIGLQTHLLGGIFKLRRRIDLHSWIISDAGPNVHVWRAAEVPNECRPFDAPAIPHLVAADVAIAVKRQRALVQAALSLETGERLVPVALPIWLDQLLQYLPSAPLNCTAASLGSLLTSAVFRCFSSSISYTLFAASAWGQNTLPGWPTSSLA